MVVLVFGSRVISGGRRRNVLHCRQKRLFLEQIWCTVLFSLASSAPKGRLEYGLFVTFRMMSQLSAPLQSPVGVLLPIAMQYQSNVLRSWKLKLQIYSSVLQCISELPLLLLKFKGRREINKSQWKDCCLHCCIGLTVACMSLTF